MKSTHISNYQVIQQEDGSWRYRYRIQDGWEEAPCEDLKDGILKLKRAAKYDRKDLKRSEISVGRTKPVTRIEIVWD